jgi:hypothetical protein
MGKQERREKVTDWPPIFGWPAMLGVHSIPTFILHSILLLSCSLRWPTTSKVKQIPFILSKVLFIFYFFEIFRFYIMQWWHKHDVEKEQIKMVDESGRDEKSNIQMVEEGQKMKCEITTDLFSRSERHILGLWARLSPYLKI